MARILLILGSIAITVFAVADWVSRSKRWTPGRVNRWVWLALIIFVPIIGPLAWVITGLVVRAEDAHGSGGPAVPPPPARPDDNPHAVSDVADRLSRRKKRNRQPRPKLNEDPPKPEDKSVDGEEPADDPPTNKNDGNSDQTE